MFLRQLLKVYMCRQTAATGQSNRRDASLWEKHTERLTLEVAGAGALPGPTRLHLEPKAESELAWAAIRCLPAAISAAVQLWLDEGCGFRQWRNGVPGSCLYSRRVGRPQWWTVEDTLYVSRRKGEDHRRKRHERHWPGGFISVSGYSHRNNTRMCVSSKTFRRL